MQSSNSLYVKKWDRKELCCAAADEETDLEQFAALIISTAAYTL